MDRDEMIEAARAMLTAQGENYEYTADLMADFALEQYEAGQRAERERIVKLLSYISDTTDSYDEFTNQTCDLIRELKAEPAESGE